MSHAPSDEWRTLIVLGWLLSPLSIVIGALLVAALAEFGRRCRARRRRRAQAAAQSPKVCA